MYICMYVHIHMQYPPPAPAVSQASTQRPALRPSAPTAPPARSRWRAPRPAPTAKLPNQDNPIMKKSFKGQILLGMDVWEHAYYLKHKADRKAYIKDFLDVVDWDVVEDRFNKFVK